MSVNSSHGQSVVSEENDLHVGRAHPCRVLHAHVWIRSVNQRDTSKAPFLVVVCLVSTPEELRTLPASSSSVAFVL